MYYTARLRAHDMGVLQLGVFTFPIHFIPPRAESFLSYGLCKTEKFEEVTPGGKPGSPPHGPSPRLRTTEAWRSGEGSGPAFAVPASRSGEVQREDGPGGPRRATGVCVGPKS